MDEVVGAEADEGEGPDDGAGGVKKWGMGLVDRAEAVSDGPEDVRGGAPQVFFWNKPKVAGVGAHGIIVSEAEIFFIGKSQPIFFNEGDVKRAIF